MQVVLDLDGTLIDSSQRHALLLESILMKKGLYSQLDKKDFLRAKTHGYSTLKYCTEMLDLSYDAAEDITSCWINDIEEKKWIDYDVLYGDAISFLDWCKGNGYKVLFLTARCNGINLLYEIEKLGINSYANEIFIVNPNNASEEKAIKLSCIKNIERVVFIGDTESDYYAGENANVKTLILNRGFRSKLYLEHMGINSYGSLIEIMRCLDIALS